MKKLLVILIAAMFVSVSCGDDKKETGDTGNTGNTGDTGNTGNTAPVEATVDEIQNGDVAADVYTDLEDVYVMSPARKHSGSPTLYTFYVHSGTSNKGLLVYKMVEGSTFPYTEGDWLDIKGAVANYSDTFESHQMQNAKKEVGVNVVSKLSKAAATIPAPITVSAADLMNPSKLYDYIGVYVTISDVKIKTIPNEFDIVLENDLVIDNMLVPANTFTGYTVGKEFATISGIFDIDYDAPTIHPKTVGDLVAK